MISNLLTWIDVLNDLIRTVNHVAELAERRERIDTKRLTELIKRADQLQKTTDAMVSSFIIDNGFHDSETNETPPRF